MAKNITVVWKRIVSFLMSSENKVEKTRDLPILDFLEILQIEYISAELRSKIYPNVNDKKYYKERVMFHKKGKIQDICSRNPALPNIFIDSKEKQRVASKVYRDGWGFPDFHYKDEQHRELFASQDFYNYFMKDTDIRIKQEDDSAIVGVLINVDRKNNIAVIKAKGEEKCRKVSLDHIARIL